MGGAISNAKGMGEPIDSCCHSLRPRVVGLFSASCIEGSLLDTRSILGAVVRRLSRGILLCVRVAVSGL